MMKDESCRAMWGVAGGCRRGGGKKGGGRGVRGRGRVGEGGSGGKGRRGDGRRMGPASLPSPTFPLPSPDLPLPSLPLSPPLPHPAPAPLIAALPFHASPPPSDRGEGEKREGGGVGVGRGRGRARKKTGGEGGVCLRRMLCVRTLSFTVEVGMATIDGIEAAAGKGGNRHTIYKESGAARRKGDFPRTSRAAKHAAESIWESSVQYKAASSGTPSATAVALSVPGPACSSETTQPRAWSRATASLARHSHPSSIVFSPSVTTCRTR